MTLVAGDIDVAFEAITSASAGQRVYAWGTACWICSTPTTVWRVAGSPRWQLGRLEELPVVRAAVDRLTLPAPLAAISPAFTEESGKRYSAFRCAGEGLHVLGDAYLHLGPDRGRDCGRDMGGAVRPVDVLVIRTAGALYLAGHAGAPRWQRVALSDGPQPTASPQHAWVRDVAGRVHDLLADEAPGPEDVPPGCVLEVREKDGQAAVEGILWARAATMRPLVAADTLNDFMDSELIVDSGRAYAVIDETVWQVGTGGQDRQLTPAEADAVVLTGQGVVLEATEAPFLEWPAALIRTGGGVYLVHDRDIQIMQKVASLREGSNVPVGTGFRIAVIEEVRDDEIRRIALDEVAPGATIVFTGYRGDSVRTSPVIEVVTGRLIEDAAIVDLRRPHVLVRADQGTVMRVTAGEMYHWGAEGDEGRAEPAPDVPLAVDGTGWRLALRIEPQ